MRYALSTISIVSILSVYVAGPTVSTQHVDDKVEIDKIEITEWVVPWENSRPRDPYVDGSGNVWFVGQRSHYVGMLDPETGAFKRYDLDDGAGPHNLIVDAAGFVWYAGNRQQHIGRLDPRDGYRGGPGC